MQHIKNFSRYDPESGWNKLVSDKISAIFLRSEDGQDWYQCQKKFSDSTFKIAYDSTGTVRSITKIVSGLFPETMSVIEMSEVPEGLAIDGTWQFDGEALIKKS